MAFVLYTICYTMTAIISVFFFRRKKTSLVEKLRYVKPFLFFKGLPFSNVIIQLEIIVICPILLITQ